MKTTQLKTRLASLLGAGAIYSALLITSLPLQAAPLIDAVKAGDQEHVLLMLKDKTDPNARESDGSTALMWAVHQNALPLAKALLEHGADVSAVNDYGSSAMLETMLGGDPAMLKLLLKHGANPNWQNPEGETPLMIAARSGNLKAAKLLLRHGADVNAQEQWGGQTALMWAVAQNQASLVKLLLDNGAQVNIKSRTRRWDRRITSEPRPKDMNKGGFTPLHYAARQGALECGRLLIKAGANLDAGDPDRVTPLNLALLNLHFDFAAMLIEAGANVNKWDLFGRSPLYMAVDMNTIPVTGRADIPSEDSRTALDIILMLLDRGANPNMQLKMRPPYRNAVYDRRSDHILGNGATALMRAAKASDDEVIKLLLEHGAMVDLPNWMGITPLMVAAGLGRTEAATRGAHQTEAQSIATLKLLLDAGAEINTLAAKFKGKWAETEDERDFFRDIPDDGQTALHGAAKLGWNQVIQFLVNQGARMQIKDIDGKTALDFAYGRYEPPFLLAPPEPLPDTIALLEKLCRESDACSLPPAPLKTQ